jgi:3-oxoacyl-(acyl-carrier-protein) synthase
MTIFTAEIDETSAICNLGNNWPQIWERLLAGKRAETHYNDISRLLPVNVKVAAIGGLKRSVEENPTGWGAASRLVHQVLSEMRRPEAGEEVAYFCGTNHGESDVITEIVGDVVAGSETPRTAKLFESLMQDPVTYHSIQQSGHSASGGCWLYSACTSGLHALALGYLHLKRLSDPKAAAVIVAADALSPLGVAGFRRLGAIATRGCVPFSLGSDGILIGEAAVAMRLSSASENASNPVVLGVGMTCDAAHPTRPEASGSFLLKAIENALSAAQIPLERVGGVIAHGTGTTANDEVESKVLSKLFSTVQPPVTSVKGMAGHCMGASGLLSVLCAVDALQKGLLPPVSVEPGERRGDIDVVFKYPREIDTNKALLVLGAGFGGNNVAVLLGNRT